MKDKIVRLEKSSGEIDEKVIEELVKAKGYWTLTAEMSLCFLSDAKDVLAWRLRFKNAIQKIYGFKKSPSINKISTIENR